MSKLQQAREFIRANLVLADLVWQLAASKNQKFASALEWAEAVWAYEDTLEEPHLPF